MEKLSSKAHHRVLNKNEKKTEHKKRNYFPLIYDLITIQVWC